MFILRQRTQMAEMVDSLCVLRLACLAHGQAVAVWLQEEPLWKKKGRQQGRFFPVYTFLPTYIASPNISQPTGVINIHEIACLSLLQYVCFLTASPRGPIPIFGHHFATISCFVGKSCQFPSSTAKYRLNDCQAVIR